MDFRYIYFYVMRKFLKGEPRYTVFGKKIHNIESGNALIEAAINGEAPCCVARIGTTEMQAINSVLNVEKNLRKAIPQANQDALFELSGFFPKEEAEIFKFVATYKEVAKQVDISALFPNRAGDYFYETYANKCQYVTLRSLEPYYAEKPWTRALKGKKVLVIHPFAETIEKQHKNRENLFTNKDILPEFQLQTLKAVQTIGENTAGFSDWFEALDWMKAEIAKRDFDVAIIGCGAYAFPLGAFVKQLGKKAVIVGGATQILFGIQGKRWDNHPVISKLYNRHWVRPSEKEVPGGFQKVENGCYW